MYETVAQLGNSFKSGISTINRQFSIVRGCSSGALRLSNWGPLKTSGDVSSIALASPPASKEGLVPLLDGSILSAHAPQRSGGGVAQGAVVSSSWDPEVFRTGGCPAIAGFNFSDDKEEISPVLVPGYGFSKPDCGSWVRKLRSGNEVRDIYHNCDNLGCPVCVDGALTKKARSAEERFGLYESAKLNENAVLIPGEVRQAIPRHIPFTISPAHVAELWMRAGRNHAVFLDLARAELNKALKSSGLLGGMAVSHSNRVKHPGTGLTGSRAKHLITLEAKLAGDMKDDSPAAALYAHIRKQKRPAEYYYFSPHFHVIGFGKLIDIREFEELNPGWTYHNKGNVPNVGGLLRYLFSHMTMIEDRHAVTWFGRLSSATLGREELKTTYQAVICEKTGLPWVVVESIDPREIGREYLEPFIEYRAFFRTTHKRGPPKIKWPRSETTRRRASPASVNDAGILAIAKYCDEYGRL